jgi:hypothetical protein
MFPAMSARNAKRVCEELVRNWPERYQAPVFVALRRLHETGRVCKGSGRTSHAALARAVAPALRFAIRELSGGDTGWHVQCSCPRQEVFMSTTAWVVIILLVALLLGGGGYFYRR